MAARPRGLVLFLLLIVALIFAAGAPAQTKQKTAAPQTLKIGFLMDSLRVERWQTDLELFQKRAKELGAEVLVETAEGDDDLQYRQAHKLLKAGVNALVIVAHDTNEAVPIVAAAKAAGVPVLCYDRLIRNSSIDFFIGANSDAIGAAQAETLVKLAPKGNYVLVAGSPGDSNAKILHEAQLRVLKPYVDRGDIKIVGTFWAGDWRPLEAYTHMVEAIESNKSDITAVVASNDGTAGGAIQALDDHKLAGKVLVSGQDADLAAIIRILDGTQTMTVYKQVSSQASQAAEIAVSLAKGDAFPSTVTIDAGNKSVPAMFIPAIVVTKDNVMETVIKDGFQNLDTIKKSLPPEKWPKANP